MTQINRNELDKITERIIGIAMRMHNILGPGFVEKIYEKAMAYEFKRNKIKFTEETEIRVRYETIELGYQRVDFLVEDEVIVELLLGAQMFDTFGTVSSKGIESAGCRTFLLSLIKCVGELNNIHSAQMLSYLKTADKRFGLILNFAENKLVSKEW